jgi:Heavy-metal resistance
MRKLTLILFLAAGFLATSPALAQRGGGSRNNNSDMMGQQGMSRPEPLDQLTSMLKLNKDQKKDVKGILDETQKEVTPLRDSMAKSREQIGATVEAGKGQPDIDQAVKTYADLEAQVTTLEAKAFSKIFAGLDADQKSNPQTLVNSLMFLHEIFRRKNWNAQPTE